MQRRDLLFSTLNKFRYFAVQIDIGLVSTIIYNSFTEVHVWYEWEQILYILHNTEGDTAVS